MDDDRVITAIAQNFKVFDELGAVGIAVVFIVIVVLFVKYIISDMKVVVNNNTKAMTDLTNNMNKDFTDIKTKQIEIHMDVKSIKDDLRYKFGINDFDIKNIRDSNG